MPNLTQQTKVARARNEFFTLVASHKPADALRFLKSDPQGLLPTQVSEFRDWFGPNVILEKKTAFIRRLVRPFSNPLVAVLLILAFISYSTGDVRGATLMIAMIAVSIGLTLVQEHRSGRALHSLRHLVPKSTTVIRRLDSPVSQGELKWQGQRVEIPISEIVPGDLLVLSAGDIIPADLRVITAKDLFISQSSLTGESAPVEKGALEDLDTQGDPVLLRNICYMGSNVVSGTAIAVAIKTGRETYFGQTAESMYREPVVTSFDKGIHQFAWLMLWFTVALASAVFLINGLTKGNWSQAFMFAVAVSVGLTPEMLPMIVTVNLAKGALAMARKKVIVKRLDAIQNLGAMNVLCTDKTGTLTCDRVALERYVGCRGRKSERVLKYAFLNSYFQTGLKSLLDTAILNHCGVALGLEVGSRYRKIDEVPFDFERRKMSVVVEELGRGQLLVCKGAPEEVMKVCTHVEIDGEDLLLDQYVLEICTHVARQLEDDGLRVIAVAYKNVTAIAEKEFGRKDEATLTLLGYLAFFDPVKDTAIEAIARLKERGVNVKILTGDGERAAKKVALTVGLAAHEILTGGAIDEIADEELDRVVDRISVFAKLKPMQKERIVKSLRRRDHVVGFLGDGINDAAALRCADVGISVENAVGIAKECADIILLEKDLVVLDDGVIEGRKVFGNIIKYLRMGASSNFGNVLSMLGASAVLPFLPMTPIQVLTQNLLYDLSQTAIPFDDVDREFTQTPRRWQIAGIGRFMIFIGPLSSIFDYVTFGLLWFVLGAKVPAHQDLFQSGWFVEGLLSQTLIVHLIRTQRIPFIQSRASWPLILMTSLVCLVGLWLPFSKFGVGIGLTPLPPVYFLYLAGILIVYAGLTQYLKNVFARRFGYNG